MRWRGRKGKVKPRIDVNAIRLPRRRTSSCRDARGGGCSARFCAPRRLRAAASRTGLSSRTMSATPLVICDPEPIATAIRACLSAGTSFTPSPIIAVKRPRSASTVTSAFFCSGEMRQKIVLLRATSPRRARSSGSSEPSITPASRRHPDRVRDGRHGRSCVARDQLQVDVLLAHELDRLRRVGAETLLQDDERVRPQARRGR